MSKKKKITKNKDKTVKSINNNIRSSVRKLNPILKGIVGKNLVNLNGLPLISYSIVSALKSNAFDKIIVSTDSEEIANVAQKYGAHVPYMRPISLACDNSSTESVIIHFLEWSKNNGWKINDVTLLQPTSPIRRISSIQSVLNKLDEYDVNNLLFGGNSFIHYVNKNIGQQFMHQPNFVKYKSIPSLLEYFKILPKLISSITFVIFIFFFLTTFPFDFVIVKFFCDLKKSSLLSNNSCKCTK